MVLPMGSRDLAEADRDLAGLADRWASAVRQTSFVALSGPDLVDLLATQLHRLAAALVADPFCDEPGYEVGAALVSARLTSEAALHRTVAVLAELPAVVGGGEHRLSGRMAALLGAVAGGFTRAVRERTVLEQERVRLAALNAVRAAERSHRESAARLRATFDAAGVAIAIGDLDGNLVDVNPALARMLGAEAGDLLGRSAFDFFHPDDVATIQAATQEWLSEGDGEQVRVERRFRRADGRVGWVMLTVSLARTAGGGPGYLVAMAEDVTERHRLQDELHHQAHHDPLTGLPNRTLLWQHLAELLGRATPQCRLGLCFLDLDEFKMVNDTLGHGLGDQLLVAVADRLHACVRDAGHFIARVGGDEFVVILCGTNGPERPVALAEAMLAALRPAINIDGHHLNVSASIGIVEQPALGADPEEILRAADTTLYWAKADGRDRWALFDAERSAHQQLRYALTGRLPAALEAGELTVEYQPIVALPRAGAARAPAGVRGAEALLRWHHPELGTLSPNTFVPAAEQTGLIVPLGRWVLRQACTQAAQWQQRLADPPFVSVNLSARQCADPGLLEDVTQALDETGLRPDGLQLELTETAVMQACTPPRVILQALADLGVRVAIDDFGIGYSNLAQLRHLPLHGLKLAGALMAGVRAATPDRVDEGVVATVVSLAHTLDLTVTAEGVENAAQAARLAALGCDLAQGWHFGRPGPAEVVERLAARTGDQPGDGGPPG